jgi:plastocyanin
MILRASALGWVGAIVLVSAGAIAIAAQETPAPGAPRVITMEAVDYEFKPASVHVKLGEDVQLVVTATDKEHGVRIKPVAEGSPKGTASGIEIKSSSDCVKFKKNETGTLEFVAHAPGTYELECCKLCGMGHGKMKGEIVVDP